jgi:hypothetical protein
VCLNSTGGRETVGATVVVVGNDKTVVEVVEVVDVVVVVGESDEE